MAVPTIAAQAARVAAQYAPAIRDAANRALAQATSGRAAVTDVVPKYVGADPRRLSTVVQAMTTAGMSLRDLMPDDLIGDDAVLRSIRAQAAALVGGMQESYAKGSDRSLGGGASDTAADMLRRARVEAVFRVYGNEDVYFLCHPNGGVPADDFAWYKAVIRGNR